jgi:membrane protein required for beta-lactamase induction
LLFLIGECFQHYARFLNAARQSDTAAKRTFYLLRAVSANHSNLEAIEELRAALIELGLQKEATLLELWANK